MRFLSAILSVFLYLEYFKSKFVPRKLSSKTFFAPSGFLPHRQKLVKPIELADSTMNSRKSNIHSTIQKNAEIGRIKAKELRRGGRKIAVWLVR